MQNNYITPRLLLKKLSLKEAGFILDLVNTAEWIKFIGDRNIRNINDSIAYIERILDSPNINYWVVSIKSGEVPIGIITFLKREYLDHHDIGFAFLPAFTKQGYAYEAASAVLNDLLKYSVYTHILATTIKENINSIQLLEKLGFGFDREIQNDNEVLHVYSIVTHQ